MFVIFRFTLRFVNGTSASKRVVKELILLMR